MFMTLPESFKNFCLNYTMIKRSYSLTELQAAEGIVGHKKSVQVMEKGSSSARKGKKKKRFQSKLHNLRINSRLVKASRKASVSHVVRRVIGRTIVQRNLALRMVTSQVCLIFLLLKHV